MWKTPETIRDLLAKNVVDFGDREAKVAVSYRSGDYIRNTWRDVDEASDRVAAGLTELGVQKGQKVACMLANHVESAYSYLAIHKIGAVFVPINIRLAPREVEYIVDNADADHFIAMSGALPLVEQVRDRLRVRNYLCLHRTGEDLPDWGISFNQLLEKPGKPPAVDIGPHDTADIIYTSGTTGLPKGVVLTQANKVACGRMWCSALMVYRTRYGVIRAQDCFPFFTSSGCSSVMMIWLYGGNVHIHEESFDVIKTLELIQKEKSTFYGGAPAMYAFILNHPRFKEFDTSSLRDLCSGAASMPSELIRKAQAAWPNIKIYNSYSLTEGGTGGTILDAADAVTKLGSVGFPMLPEQEMRVVDLDGLDVKPREVGEIVLRGPNVMKEYYKNPKATAETLKDGWLRTGDTGYYDEDGYLYFMDRLKDMIVRGGFNIYSVEVENVLYEHAAVKQCAVLAKPHPELGEDVLAFVVFKEGATATAQELHDFTKEKLADYKRPRDIRFLEALPINPTGKVDKKAIRAMIADQK